MPAVSDTVTVAATPDTAWEERTDVPVLAEREVHVWRVPLSASPAAVARASQLLDDGETARVASLARPELKVRQILSFALLRVLLARYLYIQPQGVLLRQRPTGKPYLCGNAAVAEVRFNLAHSGDMALYAITTHAEIGVDIEQRRPLHDFASMIETVLTPAERSIIRSMPTENQLPVFMDAWTLKEAYLKATGEGIAGLSAVEAILGLRDGEPVFGLRAASTENLPPWTVRLLDPVAGYSAAVVVLAAFGAFRQFALRPDVWLQQS